MSLRRIGLGKKAWELYLETDVLDTRLVRAEVANSWKRCRELKVDPLQPANRDIDETHLLRERLHRKERLCRVARPFMQDLCYFVSGSQFQVVLADEDGLLLEAMGDTKILARTKHVNLCPGVNWSEARKGTNAIGTALVEKRPVQIYAWEHFCEGNHFLTCSAAPICDSSGNVIAVLDVSGECQHANPHTLGMVVAAARSIETQLRLEQANHSLYVMSGYSSVLAHGISDGVVAVDSQGIVREVNAKGGEIFGVNPALAKGRPVEQICGDRSPILQVLADGKEYRNEEILFDRQGKRLRSSASPLRDEHGGIVGAVAVFQELTDRPTGRRSAAPHTSQTCFGDIVGISPGMAAAREWAVNAAASVSTVLILGESGTGKELFANAIHNASARCGCPFVAINCASLPESLIESELFGYAEGSFTGAKRGGRAGKFENADGGTVFLDEIGDMSQNVQSKLLRVLQERKVARIGSSHEVPVDIRVIAATHKDLRAEVKRGAFREDLYYRLAVLEIRVPPLRDRLEDIPTLAERLAAKIAVRLNRRPVEIDASFLRRLSSYDWPGNVRELENVLERAINRVDQRGVLGAELLDLPNVPDAGTFSNEPPAVEQESLANLTLREVERQVIAEALSTCGGNIRRAAAQLGIGRNTLYRKMEQYQLAPVSVSRRAKPV